MSGQMRTIPVTGAQLRASRRGAGITLEGMGRLTGLDAATITAVEEGRTQPAMLPPENARRWAKALHINPARLTGDEPRTAGEENATPIRLLRLEREWSCRQLAENAGVSELSLRKYDDGTRNANNLAAGILLKVAHALGASMERLADRPENEHTPPEPPAEWKRTRLEWHRKQADLSQAELSVRSGQTIQNIGGVEQGRWAITRKRSRFVLDVAAALDIPAEALIDPETTEGEHDNKNE
ncbi:hypothetical protein BISA_1393 [Bifidobacterium saguini DSM 23967]|uniref:HTH cro/C1-type domain-containing protein n=1 Tax=Bifidobacterium saguini DSM 23967 TaxID=1437607 RepID=A0A087DCH7_9BIFI|nr:helix-turn-helix transcriptional regulator [Bifidobacterium saguini]KFI93227.1 hypothetical protein BISA_1393 [Bifidobacterium saguini DSM 23967]